MDLQIVWFVLIAVLWSGYFLLEGFDFGVGMLLPFTPRTESERGTNGSSMPTPKSNPSRRKYMAHTTTIRENQKVSRSIST